MFQGYSHHQAQVRTGLGKGTIGRISKEVEGNRENHPGGCPSKLSPHDTQSIISQITSGKFDNAVQAIQFIDSTLYTPFTPHTVRKSPTAERVTLSVKSKNENRAVGDSKRVLWTDETKVNRVGSDWGVYVWRK